jgi:uncharacterized membrane protein
MSDFSPTTFNQAAAPAMQRPPFALRARWFFLVLLCLSVVGGASRYYFQRPVDHFGEHYGFLVLHVIGGSLALLIGPWQFSRRLRTRNLPLHRWLGRIYLLAVALGALAGFFLAFFSTGGTVTHLGFGILAILWFFTGWMAYSSARTGQIAAHREWMIRNFSLSLAAVTLRMWLPLALFAFHWPFLSSYIVISWLCWLPNIVVAEWLIRRRTAFAPI